MRDILLITNYWHFEEERASSRYFTLARMIVEAGMNLEVVTSSFYHATKHKRDYGNEYSESFPYKITLVDEWGYASNTSVKRLFSQWIFGRNVLKYLKKREMPDLIYCVVPSLEVGDLVTRYANQHNIKVIIDIQDLWPEAFQIILQTEFIREFLFYPLHRKANRIYSRADEIVAVSQTYVRRALRCSNRCQRGLCIYLGLELDKFDYYYCLSNDIEKNKDEIWIVYVGTLGYSYDLTSVIDAISLLQMNGYDKIILQVIGDGPRRQEFEEYARCKGISGVFTGKLAYADMVKRLCKCDIAVNPIVKNSPASIINKHAEYAASGLPVVNTQKSKEYRSLLDKYYAGLNCQPGNIKDLSDKLRCLIIDKESRMLMGENSRRLAVDKFNRGVTYQRIVNLLKEGKLKDTRKESTLNLQILLSTMNQSDFGILKDMNVSSDAIVINQWDRNQWDEFIYNGKQIKWITSKERGIGLSRNTALMKATADICLFSDDDVRYIEGYEKRILNAFKEIPQADAIIFDIKLVNRTKEISNYRRIKKIKRLHLFNSMRYGACRIAVRRERIVSKSIYFSLLFGGGARYSAGEDSLFIRECLRKNLKLYAYPFIIAYVDESKSSWYKGITDKLLIDKGALLTAAFPKIYPILFFYYALKIKPKCPENTTIVSIIKKFILGRNIYRD